MAPPVQFGRDNVNHGAHHEKRRPHVFEDKCEIGEVRGLKGHLTATVCKKGCPGRTTTQNQLQADDRCPFDSCCAVEEPLVLVTRDTQVLNNLGIHR